MRFRSLSGTIERPASLRSDLPDRREENSDRDQGRISDRFRENRHQLAEAATTTQRAVSYYETEAGFPPAPAVVVLAKALQVTTDELLGVKTPKVERLHDDSEARRQWKRFQMVSILPERDQKAVIRLINSLVSASAGRQRAARAS